MAAQQGSLNLGNPGYNLTVYTDYQNANFGTGNSFNARANVFGQRPHSGQWAMSDSA
jgi:hypothetical protein